MVHEQARWEPSHETVLAAGERGAVVLSEHGHELAAVEFPLPPTQRLVVADFNGDGLNDLVEVTATGLFGWTQVRACCVPPCAAW